MATRVARQQIVIEPGKVETVSITNPKATHLSAKIALNSPDGWRVDYDGVYQVLSRMRFLFVCHAIPKRDGVVKLDVTLLRDFEPNSAQLEQ